MFWIRNLVLATLHPVLNKQISKGRQFLNCHSNTTVIYKFCRGSITVLNTKFKIEHSRASFISQQGKRILGVSCSTNFAAEYNLASILHNNVRRYTFFCKGTSILFAPSGGQQKSCYLHYWECPLTTWLSYVMFNLNTFFLFSA